MRPRPSRRPEVLLPLGLADVQGSSMAPTLRPGDVLLIRYAGRPVRPGDVVVVRLPGGVTAVKRASYADRDGWFVLGDNPMASDDSRRYGAIAPEDVLGRMLLRLPRIAVSAMRRLGGAMGRT